MKEEEIIRNKLKVSKNQILENLLKKVAQFIKFTDDGDIFFIPPKDQLTEKEQIGLYLIGKYYAYREGTIKKKEVSNSELSTNLGIKPKNLSARLSELKDRNYIKSEKRGEHYFFVPLIDRFVNEILNKKKGV